MQGTEYEVSEQVLVYPHPKLRESCAPVEEITDAHMATAEKMKEVLSRYPSGLALAANQVGVMEQILVVRVSRQPPVFEVYFNPKLVRTDEFVRVDEFCLSYPGVKARLERANIVMVEAMMSNGDVRQFEQMGIAAQMWQHEVDHLNGVSMIDHLTGTAKLLVQNKLKRLERDAKHRAKGTVRRSRKRRKGRKR